MNKNPAMKWGFLIIIFSMVLALNSCKKSPLEENHPIPVEQDTIVLKPDKIKPLFSIPVRHDISIARYFGYMDSVVNHYDSLVAYPLSEHLIARTNHWIIDTLEATDYYRKMEKGIFVYNQKQLIVLKEGDSLHIPATAQAEDMIRRMEQTVVDLNIPEFKLRIMESGEILYSFPVRVGRNQRKYLATAKREVDLRTATGVGKIFRIKTDPYFVDPASGRPFTHTKRDDGKTTLMPRIPWIEPELDGHRYGQLIHPTTNPSTLNKAYSNGCIGTSEADAWRIYYYAPVGTKVVFRYDLKVIDEQGDTLQLKDIYNYSGRKNILARAIKPTVPMAHHFGCPL